MPSTNVSGILFYLWLYLYMFCLPNSLQVTVFMLGIFFLSRIFQKISYYQDFYFLQFFTTLWVVESFLWNFVYTGTPLSSYVGFFFYLAGYNLYLNIIYTMLQYSLCSIDVCVISWAIKFLFFWSNFVVYMIVWLLSSYRSLSIFKLLSFNRSLSIFIKWFIN